MKNFAPSALKWLRGEIDHEWAVVMDNVNASIETRLRDERVETALRNLSALFATVGLRTAHLLVEEIASSYVHLFQVDDPEKIEQGNAALAQGCIQLPYVLDYMATGSPDCPEAVLPTLNALRDARQTPKLRAADIFADVALAPLRTHAQPTEDPRGVEQNIARFLNKDLSAAIPLQASLENAAAAAPSLTGAWILRTFATVTQAIANHETDLHVNFQVVFKRLERELSHSPTWNEFTPSPDLLSHVVYYASQTASPLLLDFVKEIIGPPPTAEDLEKARGMLAGKNAAVIEAVGHSVKQDLTTVKENLDLFLRTNDPTHLSTLPDSLRALEEVLRMAGANEACAILEKQRSAVASVMSALKGNVISPTVVEKMLEDVAHNILLAEDSLERHQRIFAPVFDATHDDVNALVFKEIYVSFAKIRHAVSDAQLSSDSSFRATKRNETCVLLANIEGALAIIGMIELVPYVSSLKTFVQNTEQWCAPSPVLQSWADTLVAVEYYIEAKNDYLPILPDVLNFAKKAVAVFDPNHEEFTILPTIDPFASMAPARGNTLPLEPSAPTNEEVIVPPVSPIGLPLDDDIHQIFAEELDEEIASLSEWLPQLRTTPTDKDLVYNIRKSFHTIKGSGRVVGLTSLGELSWKIESTLNQVMEGKRPLTPVVLQMMEQGHQMFESHALALREQRSPPLHPELDHWLTQVEAGDESVFSPTAPEKSDAMEMKTSLENWEVDVSPPPPAPLLPTTGESTLTETPHQTYDFLERFGEEPLPSVAPLPASQWGVLELEVSPEEDSRESGEPSALKSSVPAAPQWELEWGNSPTAPEQPFFEPEDQPPAEKEQQPFTHSAPSEPSFSTPAFPPLLLPSVLPPYTGAQTDWKIHTQYVQTLQQELAQITQALERSGGVDNADREQLHHVLHALTLRWAEGLAAVETTMLEHERKVARTPFIIPPLSQDPTPIPHGARKPSSSAPSSKPVKTPSPAPKPWWAPLQEKWRSFTQRKKT